MVKEKEVRLTVRNEKLAPHFFADFERKIQQSLLAGKKVIRLDVGSPDMPPPDNVIRSLIRAVRSPSAHGYQSHRGIPELRSAWMEMYDRRYGVALDCEREVLPLMGSKEGIFHLSQAILAPGDVVIVPDPGYVTYARGAEFAGAQVFPLKLDAHRGFIPRLEDIPSEVLKRARLLWLNYPHNPTGAMIDETPLRDLLSLAEQGEVIICHDAAYSQVVYDQRKPFSIFQVSPHRNHVVEFNSLSKTYNMAGWRSGVLVGDAEVVQALFRLKSHYDSGQFLPIMKAACEALATSEAWIKKRNRVYQVRRDEVIAGLQAIGLHPYRPAGAIYVWVRLPEGWESLNFVQECLERTHVALAPGVVFGAAGEGYVRIALVAPLEDLREAIRRMKGWLKP